MDRDEQFPNDAMKVDAYTPEMREKDRLDARTAILRERWDRAYFAALTGQCYGRPTAESIVGAAEEIADLTIRRHAELMASRDAAIAEVVG